MTANVLNEALLTSADASAQLTFVYNGDRVGLTDEGTRALAAGLRSLRRLNLSWQPANATFVDAAAGALASMTALLRKTRPGVLKTRLTSNPVASDLCGACTAIGCLHCTATCATRLLYKSCVNHAFR